MKHYSIAIDGPAGAGKSTIAKKVAKHLNFIYVDTGAMYRALTYFVLQNNLNLNDEKGICNLLQLKKPQINLETPKDNNKDGRLITVFLNKKDISWDIRTEAISQGTSTITGFKCVRDYITPIQQRIAAQNPLIMEGRDITTVVLPKADLKIYLDASLEKRAYRRFRQLIDRGNDNISLKKIKQDIEIRDQKDQQKKIGTLKIADDAWVLDTTNLTIIETVNIILRKLKEKKLIETQNKL